MLLHSLFCNLHGFWHYLTNTIFSTRVYLPTGLSLSCWPLKTQSLVKCLGYSQWSVNVCCTRNFNSQGSSLRDTIFSWWWDPRENCYITKDLEAQWVFTEWVNCWTANRTKGQRPWVETMTRINESTTYVYKIPNWGQDFTGHRILLKEDRRGKRYASFLKWNMISPPTKKGTRNST